MLSAPWSLMNGSIMPEDFRALKWCFDVKDLVIYVRSGKRYDEFHDEDDYRRARVQPLTLADVKEALEQAPRNFAALSLRLDATLQEIRDAYERLTALAETQEELHRIQQAYDALTADQALQP